MAGWSPTLEGFRTMLRRPSLSLAEIMWRFSFGAAATVLCGLATIAYLDTLPVSGRDLLLLRAGHPLLVAQAIAHIFHGTALRVVIATAIMISALAILWILVASVGRFATLSPLLGYIRQRAHQIASAYDPAAAASDSSPEAITSNHLRSLAGLHFLRVVLGMAACASCVGVVVIARSVSTKADPRPGLAFLIFVSLAFLIWALWSSLSWFLAAAPIFVVREGRDTFGALLETATLFRNRPGPFIAVGSWFGLTHLLLLIGASTVVGFPLAFAGFIPPVIVLGAVFLLTLAYFALVDALYIGRLAGYVAILEAPPPPPIPIRPPSSSTTRSQDTNQLIAPEMAMVDQSETILSDTAPLSTPDPTPTPIANIKPPEESEI
jgi:hypothetical protein